MEFDGHDAQSARSMKADIAANHEYELQELDIVRDEKHCDDDGDARASAIDTFIDRGWKEAFTSTTKFSRNGFDLV